MLADITQGTFIKCLLANFNSQAVKYMQARVSHYEHSYRVLAGNSQVFHFQNPMSSRKVQVTLPLSFCHVLKRPKVIESDMLWRALVVAYLFCVLEIQMTLCNGPRKNKGQ